MFKTGDIEMPSEEDIKSVINILDKSLEDSENMSDKYYGFDTLYYAIEKSISILEKDS